MDPLLKLRPTAAGGDHLEIRFDPDSDSQICLWGKNFSTCLWRSLLTIQIFGPHPDTQKHRISRDSEI